MIVQVGGVEQFTDTVVAGLHTSYHLVGLVEGSVGIGENVLDLGILDLVGDSVEVCRGAFDIVQDGRNVIFEQAVQRIDRLIESDGHLVDFE